MDQRASTLNQEQQVAVEHVEGPLLVLAGAGSGKTRIVTYRIAYLLEQGVHPSKILAVTFTNKAAEEMRERIHTLCKEKVLATTFHSFCARLLRESIAPLGYRSDFVIFDEEDSEKLLKEVLKALSLKHEKEELKKARLAISRAKNCVLDPKSFEKEDPQLAEVYQLYTAKLKECNALDFDDLLFLSVQLFRLHPEVLRFYQQRYTFILIDEYQDVNHAQYLLIKLLAARHHNVFAVGDPDQSIYGWRGADIHNILNFAEDYPGAKIVRLEQNYRSTNTLLQAANSLIENNLSRYKKQLWSALGEGEKVRLIFAENDREEADYIVEELQRRQKEGIPLQECVIFYRTHFQSRSFEDALLRAKIPYIIVGGVSFYQRKEIKDLLAFLRMAVNSGDLLSFARTVNLPKRGLGLSTLEKLFAATHVHTQSILKTCQDVIAERIPLKFSAKQKAALSDYLDILSALKARIDMPGSLQDLISFALERTRLLEHFKEDPETYEERSGNLRELIAKAREWEEEAENPPTLALFLEELSLKGNQDTPTLTQDAVRLMTLHNSKGLEFTLVFMAGMEEDLFPHLNVKEEGIEEERRLCYVGMTRAKKHLYMSCAHFRFLWGALRVMRPSRFLAEISQSYLSTDEMRASPYLPSRTLSNAYRENGILSHWGSMDRE